MMRRLCRRRLLSFWVVLWSSTFFQIPQGAPPHSIYELLTVYVAGFSFMFAILSYLNVGDLDAT